MPKLRRPKPDELKIVAQLRSSLREFATATADIASRHQLTSRQYDLCLLIASSEGGIIARQIADTLQLSPNTASELITRAEHEGLVTRTNSVSDARQKPLTLTPEGDRRFLSAFNELRPERAHLLAILRGSVDLATKLL